MLEKDVRPIVSEMKYTLLHRVKDQRSISHSIKVRKAHWIHHILRRNCFLKHVIEGMTEGTGRRRRRRRLKQLLDDLKKTIGYYNLKLEALDYTMLEEPVDLS